jgi:hypothetical protein
VVEVKLWRVCRRTLSRKVGRWMRVMGNNMWPLLSGHTYRERAEARCTLARTRQRLRGIVKRIPVGTGQAADLGRRESLHHDHRGGANRTLESRLRRGRNRNNVFVLDFQ